MCAICTCLARPCCTRLFWASWLWIFHTFIPLKLSLLPPRARGYEKCLNTVLSCHPHWLPLSLSQFNLPHWTRVLFQMIKRKQYFALCCITFLQHSSTHFYPFLAMPHFYSTCAPACLLGYHQATRSIIMAEHTQATSGLNSLAEPRLPHIDMHTKIGSM